MMSDMIPVDIGGFQETSLAECTPCNHTLMQTSYIGEATLSVPCFRFVVTAEAAGAGDYDYTGSVAVVSYQVGAVVSIY